MAYAVLNDQESIAGGVLEAFQRYQITPVLWSHREEVRDELAA